LKPWMYNQATIPSKKYRNNYSRICRQKIQVNLMLYHPRIEYIKLEPSGWFVESNQSSYKFVTQRFHGVVYTTKSFLEHICAWLYNKFWGFFFSTNY
jgi:hypothetical protein